MKQRVEKYIPAAIEAIENNILENSSGLCFVIPADAEEILKNCRTALFSGTRHG